jgi:hypothetical protein
MLDDPHQQIGLCVAEEPGVTAIEILGGFGAAPRFLHRETRADGPESRKVMARGSSAPGHHRKRCHVRPRGGTASGLQISGTSFGEE